MRSSEETGLFAREAVWLAGQLESRCCLRLPDADAGYWIPDALDRADL